MAAASDKVSSTQASRTVRTANASSDAASAIAPSSKRGAGPMGAPAKALASVNACRAWRTSSSAARCVAATSMAGAPTASSSNAARWKLATEACSFRPTLAQ